MCNINELIGIPYKDRGNDLDGFDCAGLVRYVTGIETNIIPSVEIGHTKAVMKVMREQREKFKVLDKPIDGCIVALSRLREPHHVGVWIDGGVLHCVPKKGVVYSTLPSLRLNGFNWEFGVLKNG